MRRVPAKQLVAELHPQNWRGHSAAQRKTMSAVLERVGWVAPVIVSERSGRVIDGEMRIQIAADLDIEIEALYVNLDEEEERVALATFDAIGEMAITDEGKLDRALSGFGTFDSAGLESQPPAFRTTSVSIASMVEAVATGSILSRLWMTEEAGDEEEAAVLADDYECFWIRLAPGADAGQVVDGLLKLRELYDVRIEGVGFERLQ